MVVQPSVEALRLTRRHPACPLVLPTRVCAGTAIKVVMPRPAGQAVSIRSAAEAIASVRALDTVLAPLAVTLVVPVPEQEHVATASPVNEVTPRPSGDRVSSRAPREIVAQLIAGDCVSMWGTSHVLDESDLLLRGSFDPRPGSLTTGEVDLYPVLDIGPFEGDAVSLIVRSAVDQVVTEAGEEGVVPALTDEAIRQLVTFEDVIEGRTKVTFHIGDATDLNERVDSRSTRDVQFAEINRDSRRREVVADVVRSRPAREKIVARPAGHVVVARPADQVII